MTDNIDSASSNVIRKIQKWAINPSHNYFSVLLSEENMFEFWNLNSGFWTIFSHISSEERAKIRREFPATVSKFFFDGPCVGGILSLFLKARFFLKGWFS